MGVAIFDNSKWPPQLLSFFTLLVKKKSYSYKSKYFARVLDLRDSKFDVCLTGTLTGNTILENQIWPPVKN